MSHASVERIPLPDVSLTGRMGTGKTWLSDQLVSRAGYSRLSFAGPLKEIEAHLAGHSPAETAAFAHEVWGTAVTPEFLSVLAECAAIEREEPKPRKRLQFLGNAVRERIDPEFWVDLAVVDYVNRKASADGFHAVFDDARYPNEVERLKSLGFLTFKVEASPAARMERLGRLYGIADPQDPRLHAESEEMCDLCLTEMTVLNDDGSNAFGRIADAILDWQFLREVEKIAKGNQ